MIKVAIALVTAVVMLTMAACAAEPAATLRCSIDGEPADCAEFRSRQTAEAVEQFAGMDCSTMIGTMTATDQAVEQTGGQR